MTMDGLTASTVTAADKAAIQAGIASVMGIDKEQITIDAITDASTGRRALKGTAISVSFTVVVSLAADASINSAADLLTLVTNTMDTVATDTTDLITAIKAELTATAKWDSVSVSTTTASATCPAIDVAASASTAGASCGGGAASGSPACAFTCDSGHEHDGVSWITCDSDGECGRGRGWVDA